MNEDLEIEKMRREIRAELSQEYHWEVQREHWLTQQKHWKWVVLLGAIAILLNSLKSLWE